MVAKKQRGLSGSEDEEVSYSYETLWIFCIHAGSGTERKGSEILQPAGCTRC